MKKMLCLIFAVMFFPLNVNALTGDIVMNCDKNVLSSGESTTCKISGKNFSEKISSFQGDIYMGNGIYLSNAVKDSSWEGAADSGDIDLYTDVNKSGEVNFASFVIEAKDIESNFDTTVTLTNISIGNSKFKVTKFDDVVVKIKLSSDDSSSSQSSSSSSSSSNPSSSSSSSSSNSKVDENGNVMENPKTGGFLIVLVILLFSIIGLMFYKMKVGEKSE